jgi:hypothetical protein
MYLEENADPNTADSLRDTTLHWATLGEDIELMIFLIQEGVDIDAETEITRSTALVYAIDQGNINLAIILLAFGAKFDLQAWRTNAAYRSAEESMVAFLNEYSQAITPQKREAVLLDFTVRQKEPALLHCFLGTRSLCAEKIKDYHSSAAHAFTNIQFLTNFPCISLPIFRGIENYHQNATPTLSKMQISIHATRWSEQHSFIKAVPREIWWHIMTLLFSLMMK